MLKRVRVNGYSYLVNEEKEVVAKSFTLWAKEKELTNDVIRKKREYVLKYMSDEPNNSFFILRGTKEIYLSKMGEQFLEICQLVDKNKTMSKRNTVEQLATEKEDKKVLNEKSAKMMRLFAEMSLETNNPFSINKSFYNPFNKDNEARVFYDLYRKNLNNNEFYIVMATEGSFNSVCRFVINTAKYATLNVLFKKEEFKLYVVAPKYNEKEKTFIENNFKDIVFLNYVEMFNCLYTEAKEYYEEVNLLYKLERWKRDYADLYRAQEQIELVF